MSNNWIAFFIGLFGSVHCVGMCGPLALAVPSFKESRWLVFVDKILYNFGRVITYSLLGLLIGFAGKQLWLAGLQQGVSFTTGLLIIMAGLARLYKIRVRRSKVADLFLKPADRALSYALKHRAGNLTIGLLNGFLPCGFVYIALAGAVNTSTPFAAATYMFWFGVGTIPLMLVATLGAGYIGPVVRRKLNMAIPYVMICLGFWFILRSADLNIPYLSPAKPVSGITICH